VGISRVVVCICRRVWILAVQEGCGDCGVCSGGGVGVVWV